MAVLNLGTTLKMEFWKRLWFCVLERGSLMCHLQSEENDKRRASEVEVEVEVERGDIRVAERKDEGDD